MTLRLDIGQYVLTECRGMFFAVGFLADDDGVPISARCCDVGHTDESDAGPCWSKRYAVGVAYVRSVLVEVLVHHYRNDDSSCGCGWAELGRSHPEHVADVYEESVLKR